MFRSISASLIARSLVGLLLALSAACSGGGGGASGSGATPNPPRALTYATNPAVYTKDGVITANAPSHGGGAVTGYAVSPALPSGLALDPVTGILSGLPTAITPTATYTVTATNGDGSTTAALSVTVNDLPPTNLHYVSPTVSYTVGTTIAANFMVHEGGTVSGYGISPALPAGLVFNTSSAAISGTPSVVAATATYTVTATNSGGIGTATLSLTVDAAAAVGPAFTTQPVNQSVTAPTPASFAVVVTGTPTPTLQWQRSNNSGTTWSDLGGFTSAAYTTPATVGGDNGAQFRVVATNSAGSVASAVATLTVASLGKAWGTSERIGPISGSIYEAPQLCFDGLGNAMAVWIQETYGVAQRDLWANRLTAGSGWGTPQMIVAGVGARMGGVKFGMSADGKGLAVWEMMDDPYAPMAHIWSIAYAPGSGWGTAVGIDTDPVGYGSGSPRLAVAANGSAVAVWGQGDGLTTTNIVLIAGSTGSGWGTPTILVTAPIAQGVGGAEVALGSLGQGAVIWQQVNGSVITLRGAPLAMGVAGIPQEISANTGALLNPHVSANASGTAVAVWGQGNGSRGEIASNRYVPGTGWGAPTQVNNPAWPAFNQTPDPQIHLDDAGTATALWVEGTGASSPKFWNHQTAGGWGTAELITYSLGTYRVVGNPAGQLLGARFNGQNLYAAPAYLTSAADWGAGTQLSSTGYIPLEMAMSPDGAALTVWIQPETSGYGLWASVYP